MWSDTDVQGVGLRYFDTGSKRRIMEVELENCSVLLLHLSLKYRRRQAQRRHLHDLVVASKKPVIVAGDFNTFWGEHEIYLFMKAAGLQSANVSGLPSYPSRAPRKELDFVLYGDGVRVTNFFIPQVNFSDHLPLICDFEIDDQSQRAA